MRNRQFGGCVRGLWSDLVPGVVYSESASAAPGNILGRISFATGPAAPNMVDGAPHMTAHVSAGIDLVAEEIWRTTLPVRSGVAGDAVFAEDGEYLFYAARLGPEPVYRAPVRELYDSALRFAWEHGYTDLVRMWNFIGGIGGANAQGLGIYPDFSAGRAEALAVWEQHLPGIPAVNGIGTLSAGVDLCYLATKPGRTIQVGTPPQPPVRENRWRREPQPRSSARATYLREHGTGSLFVSGTAGLIGDNAVHADDVARQTVHTLRDIDTLVGDYNLSRYGLDGDGYALRNMDQVKVYVRESRHVPVVRDICSLVFPADSEVVYFNVDVSRADLLVAIEGVCR
jgi:chorismate lyase / 3-hydroxybenzoate synthase